MPSTKPTALPQRDVIAGWSLVLGQFALLGALVLEAARSDSMALGSWSGAALVTLAIAIVVAASLRLGSELRTHPAPSDSAVLRTDGAYHFVRHPIYSGLLLLGVGLVVMAVTWLAAVEWVAMLALLTVKARFEERLLTARFPAYSDYARHTPRFMPRVGGRSGR
ncbi:MAG: isoprenylcysteine carboxylmethyltransferase family protein [Dehalococcoidia bacterium]|nr:MAG: isoprenylcysteine carboxylmethyltransferase family protein [Dehalococcoidia bacterium]